MDYEKEYKEALERARELKNKLEKNCSLATPTGIESIFPELQECEDERIRKTLREIIIDYDPNNEILIKEVGVSQKQFLAWLKKQCEQNSTDSYCKDNCKGFQETGKCFADGDCKAKRDAEQKPTWSEEDKTALQATIDIVDDFIEGKNCDSVPSKNVAKAAKDWLKSLKPQPHWKPTEEQMETLDLLHTNYVRCDDWDMANKIKSLYNDLKKL